MNARPRLRAALVAAALVAALLPTTACNAWRVIFPAKVYETEPPALPDEMEIEIEIETETETARPKAQTSILLFTKTNSFRHHEAIAAGVSFFEAVARRRGWSLFHTENGAVHRSDLLERFDAVVWFQTSGDTLNREQKEAFKSWIEGGGGFVAIHGAGGDFSYDWAYYVDQLIGAQFVGHILDPQFQEAKVTVEDRAHPATADLADP